MAGGNINKFVSTYISLGHVIEDRINGILNLSRAFGDFDFKKNPKLA